MLIMILPCATHCYKVALVLAHCCNFFFLTCSGLHSIQNESRNYLSKPAICKLIIVWEENKYFFLSLQYYENSLQGIPVWLLFFSCSFSFPFCFSFFFSLIYFFLLLLEQKGVLFTNLVHIYSLVQSQALNCTEFPL